MHQVNSRTGSLGLTQSQAMPKKQMMLEGFLVGAGLPMVP